MGWIDTTDDTTEMGPFGFGHGFFIVRRDSVPHRPLDSKILYYPEYKNPRFAEQNGVFISFWGRSFNSTPPRNDTTNDTTGLGFTQGEDVVEPFGSDAAMNDSSMAIA